MITKRIIGIQGTNNSAIVLSVIQQLDEYLQTLDGVSFVETFNVSGNSYRYIYLINGFENLYLCFENSTSTSAKYIIMTLRTVTQIHSTSNTGATITYSVGFNEYAAFDFFLMMYDGRLKGIRYKAVDSTNNYAFWYFVNQPNGKWMIDTSTAASNSLNAYTDDTLGTRLYLTNNGNFDFSVAEQCLFRHAIISSSNAVNGTYLSMVNDLFLLNNENFFQFTGVLVEINGVRYRNINHRYLFALDGDTE